MDPKLATGGSASEFVPLDVETVKELSEPARAVMDTFNKSLAENLKHCQEEWLGFLGQRWRENMTLPTRLSGCKSVLEVQQVYVDYWQRAADQYRAEFQRLAAPVSGAAAGADDGPGSKAVGIKPPQGRLNS